MRDKDAQLIFESYRKRVLLNEAVPLAIPVAAGVGIGLTQVLGLAATVVGATALAYEISKKSDQIERFFTPTPSNQAAAEKITTIIQKKDFSIRGLYDALNFAKSLDVPALENSISMSETSLKMLQSLESGSLDQTQATDYVESLLFSFKEQINTLQTIAKKTNIEDVVKIIELIGGIVAAQQATIDKTLDKLPSGGSNKEPDKEPDKGPKTDWWRIIKDFVKGALTIKGLIIISILIITASILGLGAKGFGSAVTGGTIEAVRGLENMSAGAVERIKQEEQNTRWVPEEEVSPSQPNPSATPVQFKIPKR